MTVKHSVTSKDKYVLDKVSEEGRLITKIATELGYMKTLEDNDLIAGDRVKAGYEKQQLKTIKNAITNIYLMLDLHEVKGMCDDVYNKNFDFGD
ncbi:MAG: hypothetical protein MRZ42_01540 [Tenericutes bacterium]|nr:hypothetical protein [Mycoplasmatota bacterium]